MYRLITLLTIGFGLLLAVGTATAQEEEISEDDIRGEVKIKIDKEYARVRVNGEEWEAHEFADNGKTVIIRELDRGQTYTVTLTPTLGEFGPAEVTIAPDDYKKAVKRKGRTRFVSFTATKSVKFEKAPPAPAGDTPPPSEGGGKLDSSNMGSDE